jgi:SAM-dependent methyltransferase
MSARDGEGLEQARGYWDERASRAATDCERTEQNRRPQRMRFEAFVLFHDLAGKSILDIGCGAGDFWEHLQARGIACDYLGTDLSPEMIRRCRERFPGVAFEAGNVLEWDTARQFDYTVAFGVHAIRVEGLREIMERITRQQFALSRVAAHVTFLTDRYSGFAPHIHPWNAEEMLRFGLSLTPYVVLRHDYLPNDFSLTLYREPLIDTRRDLKLD